jgi:hypothetical protein
MLKAQDIVGFNENKSVQRLYVNRSSIKEFLVRVRLTYVSSWKTLGQLKLNLTDRLTQIQFYSKSSKQNYPVIDDKYLVTG